MIFGVRSTKIQRRLVSEKELTFDKACEHARMMETTETNLNEMQNGEMVAAFSRQRTSNKPKGQNTVFSRLSAKGMHKEKVNRYENYECFICKKKGHIQRNCYKNPERERKQNFEKNGVKMNTEGSDEEASENDGMHHINSVLAHGPHLIEVSINSKNILMEVDTGACKTVMHIDDFEKHFTKIQVKPCVKKLFSVSGEQIKINGSCRVIVKNIEDSEIKHECELIVVDSRRNFIPLLGRNWLDTLYPQWRCKLQIGAIAQKVEIPPDATLTVEN